MISTSFIPKICHICGLVITHSVGHSLWCHHCQRYLHNEKSRCLRCGIPISQQQSICGECLTDPPPWQRLYCIADYRYPFSSFIHKIKRYHQPWLLPPLIDLLAKRIVNPAPVIITVPMVWYKEWWRGFNLSEVMAYELQKHYPNLQIINNIFRKHSHTPTQKSLNRAARFTNVQNAFSLQQSLNANHIAIIDDVVTTGATVRHLAMLLQQTGIDNIDIYCLCRTPF